jgi:glycosyltransferase 2 family protein
MTRRTLWRVGQTLVVAVVIWFAGTRLWQQWNQTSRGDLRISIDVPLLLIASLIVFATYLLLIEVWRAVLARYGKSLPRGAATRIWFASNLGKYVPGKIWQITAMTMFVTRYGVTAASAGAAAILITIANVAAGFAYVLAGGVQSLSSSGGSRATLLATVVLIVLLSAAPLLADGWSVLARRLRRPHLAVRMPVGASVIALLGSAVAWMMYGVAFRLFAGSLIGTTTGSWFAWGGAYTLSYLVGYLTLISPGGLGIREVTLSQLLTSLSLTTPSQAIVITLASRLWLTILEIAPGIVALLLSPEFRAGRTRALP